MALARDYVPNPVHPNSQRQKPAPMESAVPQPPWTSTSPVEFMDAAARLLARLGELRSDVFLASRASFSAGRVRFGHFLLRQLLRVLISQLLRRHRQHVRHVQCRDPRRRHGRRVTHALDARNQEGLQVNVYGGGRKFELEQ